MPRSHMLVSIPPKMSVSGFMGYLKGKSSLLILEIRKCEICIPKPRILVQGIIRGYCGEEHEGKKEYIADQLKRDQESDQLSMFDPRDPFMGSK